MAASIGGIAPAVTTALSYTTAKGQGVVMTISSRFPLSEHAAPNDRPSAHDPL